MARNKSTHKAGLRELAKMVTEFLDEYRETDGGWAPVTVKDMEQLATIIDYLISLKTSLDPDGDNTIEYTLVNRVTHERLHYRPVPYEYKRLAAGRYEDDEQLFEDAYDVAELNFHMAMERYKTMNSIRRLNRREKERQRGAQKEG